MPHLCEKEGCIIVLPARRLTARGCMLHKAAVACTKFLRLRGCFTKQLKCQQPKRSLLRL